MVRTSFAQVGQTQRYEGKRTHGEQRSPSVANGYKPSKQKIFETFGIDLRNQERDGQGRKVWSPEIRKQIVAAIDSGKWPPKAVLNAVGVFHSQVNEWRELYFKGNRNHQHTNATNPEPNPTVDELRAEQQRHHEQQHNVHALEEELQQEEEQQEMFPEALSNPPQQATNGTTTMHNRGALSNEEIREKFGLDYNNQITVNPVNGSRIFPTELRQQITDIVESRRFGTKTDVLLQLGIAAPTYYGWVKASGGVRAPVAGRPRGRPPTNQSSHEDVAALDRSNVRSMATSLAQAQVNKRQQRVQQHQANGSNEPIQIQTSSIDMAIRILEGMRHNPAITRVSMELTEL